MHINPRSFPRMTSVVALVVMLSLFGFPASTMQAKASEQTVFLARFGNTSSGPITEPLSTEIGTVSAEEGIVAINEVSGSKALTVDGTNGQSTALLQFSNYPEALPVKEKGAVQLRVEAYLTMPISGTSPMSDTTGASFGLFADPTFFEFFSFGSGGMLTRNGEPLGLIATPGSQVRLEARVKVGPGRQKVWMQITTSSATKVFNLTLSSGLTRDTINQLRFQAAAGSALTALDNVRVRILPAEANPAPPAVIVVGDKDIEQEIEHQGDITFVNISITIINTGGDAKNVFLVLNMADFENDFDLADLSFLVNTGYVAKIEGKLMYIGLGPSNFLDHNIKLKFKFKAKQTKIDIKLSSTFKLVFNDSSGAHTIDLPPVVVVVPALVVAQPVLRPTVLPVSSIDIRFKSAWERDGGTAIFGLPISQTISTTNGLIVQYFERARLELHNGNVVQIGLIAVELGYTEPPTTTMVPTATSELVWFFQPTGHLIAKPFRTYWKSRGGLAIFGMPIGEVRIEQGREVQYFERARLELHPEYVGTANEVQLGLLGIELLTRQQR